QLSLEIAVIIVIVAAIAEYIDSTLGMGYGTILTPILILLGFEPFEIIPSILLSELITGFTAGFTHHYIGNVDFRPKTMNLKKIFFALKEYGIFESFNKGIPFHLKIVILVVFCSIFGTLSAVFLAINLSDFYLKLCIGILITAIGLLILSTLQKDFKFSWKKITLLGLIASFNKGISGGGFGPVVTVGQLLSGIRTRSAVAITSLAEGLVCLVGVSTYLLASNSVNWKLAPYLIMGGLLTVPLSAVTVRRIKTIKLRISIGIITFLLGVLSILKIIL
ncbi:sulfite exporter TauE/SafE family protein, partial [candidate division KSB1 bacterium]